jgi:hypothetical protein
VTDCQHCKRPTDLFLCADCVVVLAEMIGQLPWLLDELDARIQRLDRVSIGTIGRQRRPDELNVMDFDAAEIARKAEQTIRDLVTTINGPGPIRLQCTVTHNFIGPLRPAWRRLPCGYRPTRIELIDWLTRRVDAIARHEKAGHVYRELKRLVGSDQRGGQLLKAINLTKRHFAGLCPTVRGHGPDGEAIECEQPLYADVDERTTECPTCGQTIDVERNRRDTAAARDLRTADEILEILANLDEPVEPKTLNAWIQSQRLRPKGWRHDGAIVETRINQNSQPVYSLKRARKLRHRDQQLTKMRAKVRAT